ncbi:MAG: hypothetical protein A2075_05820 [Geobacteraceae bacterium GWC2_58_44]|nr:MAG: hypothetical protein A2075_05820 [Geobacteraceae bacterium GWC2_58_44]
MAFSLNQNRLVSALEKVADPVVIPVKLLGVHSVKLPHSSAKSTIEGFDHDVVVATHEAVSMTNPVEEIAAFGKDVEEGCTVVVVAENIFSFIAARGDVIHCSGKFDTQRTSHRKDLISRGRIYVLSPPIFNRNNVEKQDLTPRPQQ